MYIGQLGVIPMDYQGFHRPASIMKDFLHDPANVTIAFGEVKRSESCRGFVVVGMGLELEARRYMVEGGSETKINQKNTK